MTSTTALRALWILAAGACISLGAGSGVAAADTDSSDGGTQSSSESSESSESSPSSASTQDAPTRTDPPSATVDASTIATDSDRGQDAAGSATQAGQPASTVSASTVTVRRDETEATEPKPTEPKATEPEAAEPETIASKPTPAAEPEVTEPTVTEPEVTPVVVEEPAPEAAAPTAHVVEPAASRSLAAPAVVAAVRPTPGPIATILISLLSPFGLMPTLPPAPVYVDGIPAVPVPGTSQNTGVTGVKVGSSSVAIPVGGSTYTGAADWYFPTQADGVVRAQGVTLLQHGFLGSNFWYSALAADIAQRTNSIVVVPNIPSFGFFTCGGCTLSAVPMAQGVAGLFLDPNRTSLTASALAAGYHGVLPDQFVLTGHSAGGGLATAAGGYYADTLGSGANGLRGVVMYDGVSSNGTFANALASLDRLGVPVYQVAAPPQSWNANGQTTTDLVALRPGRFVGTVLANGSHVDSLIGGSPLIDFVSQLLIKPSPPGNTQAVYTLANGWINDMYAGLGPADDAAEGTYGAPGQYVVLGQTAGVVLGPLPGVDLNRYLGTWYEVGSIRQFFSLGLVNTTAVYSLNDDKSIRVENSGNYFFDNGPQSRIVGTALPVDATNNALNVAFFGPASATPPGNYSIVDLAPDYSWAVVTDPRRATGFLLSRTPTVSDALYQELLDRASVKGVNTALLFRTRQYATAQTPVSV